MSNVVTDLRVGNAILRKMAKENNFDIDNVWMHTDYKYVCTIDHDKKDADLCVTQYKDNVYKVNYFSGCFNPYIEKIS
jgi:hypothetical protein